MIRLFCSKIVIPNWSYEKGNYDCNHRESGLLLNIKVKQ